MSNGREVWAWGMYDLANQSFALLIITLLFSIYVQEIVSPGAGLTPDEVAAVEVFTEARQDDPTLAATAEVQASIDRIDEAAGRGQFNWSLLQGSSMLLVVLLSPLVGAMADARGWRKQFLIAGGFACALLTASLAGVGPGMLWLAALLYIPANLLFQLGENVLASFLPDVATPRTIGRVSALGWTMGYIGALMLLVITGAAMQLLGLAEPVKWRVFFIFAGVWFALGIVPATLLLRNDPPDVDAGDGRSIVVQSVGRLLDTAKRVREYRQLATFLAGFFVYGFGVQVIIAFAGILAKSFGFVQTELVLFVAQITVVAGIAAALTGRFQDRIGAKNTVLIYLGVWIISCSGLLAIELIWPTVGPKWPLWIVGNGLGLGLGGIGTSSRAMVARFTPPHRSAEFFGLWGLAYKLAGALGTLSFGVVAAALGQAASLGLLLGFFVVGTILVLPVNETAGLCAARRAQRRRAAELAGQS